MKRSRSGHPLNCWCYIPDKIDNYTNKLNKVKLDCIEIQMKLCETDEFVGRNDIIREEIDKFFDIKFYDLDNKMARYNIEDEYTTKCNVFKIIVDDGQSTSMDEET